MKSSSSDRDKYRYIEIALQGRNLSLGTKQKAVEFFLSRGIPQTKLVLSDYRGIFRASCYTRFSRSAGKWAEKFSKSHFTGLCLKTKVLSRNDWFDKWKRDYHIRPLGSKFIIVPMWEKSKWKACRRIPIYLDPGSAFGSGYHETTRLMIRLLESIAGKIKNFLDIGTGTGILAVTASKLGAQEVIALDHDRPSVLAAKRNFRINGCRNGKFFGANLKRLKLQEQFHVVGANLLSQTLLECRKQIRSRVRQGGYLLISGIVMQNLPGFRDKFEMPGMKCLRILRGRRWVALLYKKGRGRKLK